MTTTVQKNSDNLHDLCMLFLENCKMLIFFVAMLDEVYVYAGLKSLIYYAWLTMSKSDSDN